MKTDTSSAAPSRDFLLRTRRAPGSDADALAELAQVLLSRGIQARVEGGAVSVWVPRRYQAPSGTPYTVCKHVQVRSLAELGERLCAWSATPADEPSSHPGFLRLQELPPLGPRTVIGLVVAFLCAAAALEDLSAAHPAAPVGTLSIGAFALWQAARRPQQGAAAQHRPARLYTLACASAVLVMVMLVGHSFDNLLFGNGGQPLRALATFGGALAVLMALRLYVRAAGSITPPPRLLPPGQALAVLAAAGIVFGVSNAGPLGPRHAAPAARAVPVAAPAPAPATLADRADRH